MDHEAHGLSTPPAALLARSSECTAASKVGRAGIDGSAEQPVARDIGLHRRGTARPRSGTIVGEPNLTVRGQDLSGAWEWRCSE